MSVQDVLIATKFHIPAPDSDILPRGRLFQLLNQGLSLPMTLVSAPPGFGKTVLMADWIHHRVRGEDLKIAWLSIDKNDNKLDSFWRYFVAALNYVSPGTGEHARQMLTSPARPDIQTILGRLINELTREPASILIVLDDYHLIHSPEIHASLIFFLDHLPPTVHLSLLTREDPPLGLARRRARRQMVEMRAADLRFDLQESIAFLNETCKLGLTSVQIEILEQRTEGWIAGLQMAALSLKGRDTKSFFESFSGDDRYIADYLIEEVLQLQDEPVRQFLLKTSILDRLSAPLCAMLIDDSSTVRTMLDHLEHANLFLIPLDNHREWYRYHHLFRDLLRQRLGENFKPVEISSLYRAASTWFEEQGEISSAVQHALQIPDTVRAIELLKNHSGHFFADNQLPQFLDLVQELPVEQIKQRPQLCMAIAWASLAINQAVDPWLGFIEEHFHLKAEVALSEEKLNPEVRSALLEVLILRQQGSFQIFDQTKKESLLVMQHQLDSLPADQRGLFNTVSSLKPVILYDLGLQAEQADEADAAARYFSESVNLCQKYRNYHLLYLSLGHLASTQISQSHLQSARQTYEQALALYTSASVSPFIALAHAGLSAIYYEWGDLEAAEKHLMEGMPLSESWNNWESLIPLKLNMARLEARRGDIQKALASLEDARTPPHEGIRQIFEAYAMLLRMRESDTKSASTWLTTNAALLSLEVNPASESLLLDVARILTGLSRFEDAILLSQKIAHFAETGRRSHILIQAKTVLAKALSLNGTTQDAVRTLLEALQLAEPGKYLSTFVDEGTPILELLRLLKSQAPVGQYNYVEEILTGFGVGGDRPVKQKAVIRSELSEREQEVLMLVAEGLSNQEIAERLVISVTTVKTHIGNIFNKLGVTSRTQALARAAEHGLLPAH